MGGAGSGVSLDMSECPKSFLLEVQIFATISEVVQGSHCSPHYVSLCLLPRGKVNCAAEGSDRA